MKCVPILSHLQSIGPYARKLGFLVFCVYALSSLPAEKSSPPAEKSPLLAEKQPQPVRFIPRSPKFIQSVNFPRAAQKKRGDFITARELDIWARNKNLLLMPDCYAGGFRNFLAEIIPPQGLDFELSAPGKGRVFLYLDVATYRPLAQYDPTLDPGCDTSRNMMHRSGPSSLSKTHWLDVIVNGRVLTTLYQGGGNFIISPVRIIINREHAQDRRLKIRLVGSPGDAFFAIWDAFVLEQPYEDGGN